MAAFRLHELRQHRKAEQRHLWVGDVGEEPTPIERAVSGEQGLCEEGPEHAGSEGLPRKIQQIGRTEELQRRKRGLRGLKQDGHAERDGQRMPKQPGHKAKRREHARPHPVQRGLGQHNDDVRPRRHSHQQRCHKKRTRRFKRKHTTSAGVALPESPMSFNQREGTAEGPISKIRHRRARPLFPKILSEHMLVLSQ